MDDKQKGQSEPQSSTPRPANRNEFADSLRQQLGNDNQSEPQPGLRSDFIMGLRFFSRLPSGSSEHQQPALQRIVPALGFVSLVIGLLPVLVMGITYWLGFPALLSACFGVATLILVTGAMAEDAVADSADGLWGGHSVAQRLEIMKDSRHGTYGVIAIVLLIAMRVAALSGLVVVSIPAAMLIWLGVQVLSRQLALWLPAKSVPVRLDGAGQSVGELPLRTFGFGLLLVVPLFLILAGPVVGIAGVCVAILVAAAIVLGWTRLCHNLVGGYTGDLIGGLQALLEIGLLCVLILFI